MQIVLHSYLQIRFSLKSVDFRLKMFLYYSQIVIMTDGVEVILESNCRQ